MLVDKNSIIQSALNREVLACAFGPSLGRLADEVGKIYAQIITVSSDGSGSSLPIPPKSTEIFAYVNQSILDGYYASNGRVALATLPTLTTPAPSDSSGGAAVVLGENETSTTTTTNRPPDP